MTSLKKCHMKTHGRPKADPVCERHLDKWLGWTPSHLSLGMFSVMCPCTLTGHFIHCVLPAVEQSRGWQTPKTHYAILTMEFKIICFKVAIWLNFYLQGSSDKNSSWSVTSHQNPALEFHTSWFYSCKAPDVIRLSLLVLLQVLPKKSNTTSKTPWI